MLKTNTKAPIFKLPSTSKDNYSLKHSIGKYVVIYFYPKDDTPGCTIETNDFNKLLTKFKKFESEVYGVSKDNLKSHDKFRDKYKITAFFIRGVTTFGFNNGPLILLDGLQVDRKSVV